MFQIWTLGIAKKQEPQELDDDGANDLRAFLQEAQEKAHDVGNGGYPCGFRGNLVVFFSVGCGWMSLILFVFIVE